MIDVNQQYEMHVAARLLEFFGAATAWHRNLWIVGLVLTLKELLEAAEAARGGVLFQNSVETSPAPPWHSPAETLEQGNAPKSASFRLPSDPRSATTGWNTGSLSN
jgi:hypothetical protein